MVRFGKIISIDRKSFSAIIRENTPYATEFLVLAPELFAIGNPTVNSEVSFRQDKDYKTTPVACNVTVHRQAATA